MEADAAAGSGGRIDELMEPGEEGLKVAVMAFQPAFHFGEAGGGFHVEEGHLPEADEGLYHRDGYLNGAVGIQDGGGHQGSVFGVR